MWGILFVFIYKPSDDGRYDRSYARDNKIDRNIDIFLLILISFIKINLLPFCSDFPSTSML
jgi:hypothetical protein